MFPVLGFIAKSRLITASLPSSTASIFDVLYTHLLLTRPKITFIASIFSYKEQPWVYNLKDSQASKSLSFTSPFFRSNVQPVKVSLAFYFHCQLRSTENPQIVVFSWASVSGLRVSCGSEAHKAIHTEIWAPDFCQAGGSRGESCAGSNNVGAIQHHKPWWGSQHFALL